MHDVIIVAVVAGAGGIGVGLGLIIGAGVLRMIRRAAREAANGEARHTDDPS